MALEDESEEGCSSSYIYKFNTDMDQSTKMPSPRTSRSTRQCIFQRDVTLSRLRDGKQRPLTRASCEVSICSSHELIVISVLYSDFPSSFFGSM